MTQQDVADKLDWSLSKVVRIENGLVAVATSDLVALLTQFKINDPAEMQSLVDLARSSREPTVTSEYADVLRRPFIEWLEHEAYATVVRQFETKLIPGILQTRSYAKSIVRAYLPPETHDRDLERVVNARLERSKSLTGPDGPDISIIIDEWALRRGIGNENGARNYEVMVEQLRHLKVMNTRGRAARNETIEPWHNSNISIQIIPLEIGAYPMMRGPFELLEFEGSEDDNNMVFFENPEADKIVILDDINETAPYFDEFRETQRRLAEPAVTNDHLDIIIRYMEERQNGIPAEVQKLSNTT